MLEIEWSSVSGFVITACHILQGGGTIEKKIISDIIGKKVKEISYKEEM